MKRHQRKTGRPAHVRTDQIARTVESMAGFGIPHVDIAKAVSLSEPTVRKHYGPELNLGQVKANTQVAQSLFRRAVSDSPNAVTAAILWLKCRAGWCYVPYPLGKKEAAQQAAMATTDWLKDLLD